MKRPKRWYVNTKLLKRSYTANKYIKLFGYVLARQLAARTGTKAIAIPEINSVCRIIIMLSS